MSVNNLQNEIQFEFIINIIKEIRNKDKRPDNQTIFDHVTKTAATNMDHSQINELISSKKWTNVRQTIKKRYITFCYGDNK